MQQAIQVGSAVRYWRGEELRESTVVSIQRAPLMGDRFGRSVESISWEDRRWGSFLLADGGCCVGSELEE